MRMVGLWPTDRQAVWAGCLAGCMQHSSLCWLRLYKLNAPFHSEAQIAWAVSIGHGCNPSQNICLSYGFYIGIGNTRPYILASAPLLWTFAGPTIQCMVLSECMLDRWFYLHSLDYPFPQCISMHFAHGTHFLDHPLLYMFTCLT